MKSTVFTIFKKECTRIISDRKLFFTAVLLPGVLIFVMYNLMGTFMNNMFEVDDTYVYQVHAVNMPDSVATLLSPEELRLEIINANAADVDRIKDDILGRETDLLVIFPPGFDAHVFGDGSASVAPNIEIWSNSARPESQEAQRLVSSILHGFHHSLTYIFHINAPTADAPDGNFDLATDADMFGMLMGFLIPMLFIMFIFQSCQALAPESISGEKERGTLGALLVTPARRSDMALGKILGTALFSLLGGIGAMVGTILAMPAFIGLEGNILEWFSIMDFALLMLVALSTTLAFVGVLSVMSAYAKTVKEATAYSMPIMLVSMLMGLGSTILGRVPGEVHYYLIPVFNSALSISAVFGFETSAVNMAVTAGVNLLFTVICAVVLAKIFDSEKIVFDK